MPETTPKVTVLIPVYNAEPYLKECIESILNGTFTDFELLLIDDCSTDSSVEIIRSVTDPRIRLVVNSRNMGIARNRNKGFDLSRGGYIAFVDNDDISTPDRLEKQTAFMDAHPEVGFCGSWIQEIYADGRPIENGLIEYPASDAEIRERLFRECPIWNPSLMIRQSVITRNNLYHDADFTLGEDFELFVRASRVTQMANIPEVLYLYRRHDHQATTHRTFDAWRNSNIVRMQLMLDEVRKLAPEVKTSLTPVKDSNNENYFRDLLAVDELLTELYQSAGSHGKKILSKMKEHLSYIWLSSLFYLPRYDMHTYRLAQRSNFFKTLPVSARVKILGKSLIGLDKNSVRQIRSVLKGKRVNAWQ